MHCMYCGMPNGTPPDEAMWNSEKIKPIALAIIELHLPEGIRRAGGQAGRQVPYDALLQLVSVLFIDVLYCLYSS